jgi:hypothetical protein
MINSENSKLVMYSNYIITQDTKMKLCKILSQNLF